MTLALPKTQPINWKRIIGGLSVASAALLAVAAIVGSGVLSDNEQASLAGSSRPIPANLAFSPSPITHSTMTYFLVDSAEQRDLVIAQQAEEALYRSDPGEPGRLLSS